ncbi:MAG: ATP synthase F1 subunit epsilon [Clostridia bacterium]|nr:ATP synthase F1 subunit epsilon [Clostridia bacterium]
MANTFHLQIVTPDRPIYDGQAEKVILRTLTGDVCILDKHIDYAAPLGIGEARVTDANGKTRAAACNGGLVSVESGKVRVLATTFEWADEIDVERANRTMEATQEKLKHTRHDDVEYAVLEAKLKRALLRIHVVE